MASGSFPERRLTSSSLSIHREYMHQGLCALAGRRVGQAFELAGAAVRRKWPLAKAGRGERVERQSPVHSREPVGSKKEVASGEPRKTEKPGLPGTDRPHLWR